MTTERDRADALLRIARALESIQASTTELKTVGTRIAAVLDKYDVHRDAEKLKRIATKVSSRGAMIEGVPLANVLRAVDNEGLEPRGDD